MQSSLVNNFPILVNGGVGPIDVLKNLLENATEECQRDVQAVFSGMNNSEIWSYSFLDATTKIPNGILTGNLVDLGNYDQCLQIQLPNSSTTGKHCLASISLGDAVRMNDSLGVLPSFLWSYCIPSTCSSENLQDVLNNTWFEYTRAPVSVPSGNCHIPGNDTLDGSVLFGISFCAVFLAICLASTVYDIYKSEKAHGVLRSFSLRTNGIKLLQVGSNLDTMRPLNGLRFLSMAWILLGHRYFFQSTSPLMNLAIQATLLKKVDFQLIAGGELAVDTFFQLSGLLNAYYLMKVMDSTKTFPLFKYYFHRYIRTTPALAVMILIYATWFVHIGDGPMWTRSNRPWQQMCQDNWWVNLLYINNYYHSTSQCAGQTWYLAVDMQLYWIAPLVILPCWKWPSISKILLPVLLVMSAVSQFVVTYVDKIRMPITITQDLDEYKKVTEDLMVPTHTRATPYIIGIMLGLFLHKLRKSNSSPSVANLTVCAGWLLSAGCCLAALLGNYPLMLSEEDHPYNRLESSFYIGLFRLAWGAGISWVIFACLFGYGGFVNYLLSWNGFVPLSRLTYAIFLTHLSVLQYQLGMVRTAAYLTDFEEVHRFFGDLVMSTLTATCLYLMFESPVMALEKHFRTRRLEGNHNEAFVAEPDGLSQKNINLQVILETPEKCK